MKMFAWNCRGLCKPRAVRELTYLVSRFKPKVIGLMETKIDKQRLDHIRCSLGFKHGVIVDRIGIAGGIVLWWLEEGDVQILNFSKFHIDA